MAKLGSVLAGAQKLTSSPRRDNPDGRMPLMDHIRELRNRIVKIALFVVLGMALGFAFFHPIWGFIVRPYCRAVVCKEGVYGHQLVVNGPLDGFYLHMKVAFLAGIVLTSPFWLYQLWAFIAPGLYTREKKWSYIFLGAAVPLFALGTYFSLLVMGRGLKFLIGFVPGQTVAQFSVDTYIGYFIAMVLGFGLCFELPLVLVILNQAGILPHSRFKKMRRLLIFLVFVFAGIASPSPDPISMLMLGGVCVVLVEAAEGLVYLNDRRRAKVAPYEGLSEEEFEELRRGDLPVEE
ncbi:MAG TPA: twin-arginine translocase subunit TatC [Streptosporangiaceae bacterium]|nr:twin-arginine translocase subunit TatC [Streptosporangiaceae bacterium]